MKEILSFSDFQEKTRKTDSFYLLFHKSGSNSSDCAFNAIRNTHSKFENIKVFSTDVSTIKDIHTLFGVNSVPTLLEINKDKIQNMVKGCQNEDYFSLLFEKSFFQNKNAGIVSSQPPVSVYSTPSCSWCNTLKTYLRKNNISFTDIDVSRDEQAAKDMVARSGQQGVPQTNIGGTIVIGFDRIKINNLLGIKG